MADVIANIGATRRLIGVNAGQVLHSLDGDAGDNQHVVLIVHKGVDHLRQDTARRLEGHLEAQREIRRSPPAALGCLLCRPRQRGAENLVQDRRPGVENHLGHAADGAELKSTERHIGLHRSGVLERSHPQIGRRGGDNSAFLPGQIADAGDVVAKHVLHVLRAEFLAVAVASSGVTLQLLLQFLVNLIHLGKSRLECFTVLAGGRHLGVVVVLELLADGAELFLCLRKILRACKPIVGNPAERECKYGAQGNHGLIFADIHGRNEG